MMTQVLRVHAKLSKKKTTSEQDSKKKNGRKGVFGKAKMAAENKNTKFIRHKK